MYMQSLHPPSEQKHVIFTLDDDEARHVLSG